MVLKWRFLASLNTNNRFWRKKSFFLSCLVIWERFFFFLLTIQKGLKRIWSICWLVAIEVEWYWDLLYFLEFFFDFIMPCWKKDFWSSLGHAGTDIGQLDCFEIKYNQIKWKSVKTNKVSRPNWSFATQSTRL